MQRLSQSAKERKAERLFKRNTKVKQDYVRNICLALKTEVSEDFLNDPEIDPLVEFSEHESPMEVGFYSSVESDICNISLKVIGNSPMAKNSLAVERVLQEAIDIYAGSRRVKRAAIIFRADSHYLVYTNDEEALELVSRLSFFVCGKLRVIGQLSDYVLLKTGGVDEQSVCTYADYDGKD